MTRILIYFLSLFIQNLLFVVRCTSLSEPSELANPASEYDKPLDAADCNELTGALAQATGVEVTIEEADFED